jgi:hypothetical protein
MYESLTLNESSPEAPAGSTKPFVTPVKPAKGNLNHRFE